MRSLLYGGHRSGFHIRAPLTLDLQIFVAVPYYPSIQRPHLKEYKTTHVCVKSADFAKTYSSQQDLKDFARQSGLDVVYSEVGRERDGKGSVNLLQGCFNTSNLILGLWNMRHQQIFEVRQKS